MYMNMQFGLSSSSLKRSRTGSSRQGSALLVTLLVVSLLLVMVLSLVVVVRMELRKVVQHQEMLQARANARLGAEMAVARLQELTGADTRVTLPAEADAAQTVHPQNRHWSGVRDAASFVVERDPVSDEQAFVWNEQYAAHLGWLISGNTADPALPSLDEQGNALENRVLVVGGGSVVNINDRVAVPKIEIENHSGASGMFAWWAGEENTKAQINLIDPFEGNAPERAMTVQRTASEQLLLSMDPANPDHQNQISRMQTRRQIDLADFQGLPDAVPGPELFHGVTLEANGLPVNVRLGGLKRDLTPVIEEAWNNNGAPPAGTNTQFAALVEDQEQRITRQRAQTLALPASRPDGVPLHAWNAARAMTLRSDQADISHSGFGNGLRIPELIFPPFSDMQLSSDFVPSWRQLISFLTLNAPGRGVSTGNGYRVGRHTQDEIMPFPVISRMNMGIYFTIDEPGVSNRKIRVHFVPQVVIWNPWSEPLDPEGPLYVRFEFSNSNLEGFKLYFRVSHDDWDDGRHRWTGGYSLDWAAPPGSDGSVELARRVFILELEPARIPAGASMVYTMDSHQRFEIASPSDGGRPLFSGGGSRINPYPFITVPDHNSANRDVSGILASQPIAQLRPGLHDGGGFSMYLEENFHDKIIEYATVVTTSGGGYTDWRAPRFPMYPPDPEALEDPDFDATAHRNLSINERGLEGWDFHETRITWSRSDTGSSLGSSHLTLGLTPGHSPTTRHVDQQAIFGIQGKYGGMPAGFHSRGVGQGGWDRLPRFADGLPPSFPGDSTPFNFDAFDFPSFPTWGLTWSIRVPETRFKPDPDLDVDEHLFAPLQWLAQSNPTAAYHIPTPNLMASSGEQRNFGQVHGYIGGFTLDGPEFFDLSEFTDESETFHLFGHSDHEDPLGYEIGDIPRVILRQAPASVDELTSIASMQHAPLMGMDLIRSDGMLAWRGSTFPMHLNFRNNGGNLNPAYAIGNSILMPFADPDQAFKNLFFRTAVIADPLPSPPFTMHSPGGGNNPYGSFDLRASPWYDLSWTLNHVLWDDYLFTSPANSRILWEGEAERDYFESSERLRIAGAFNVNSTSVQAWTALLASLLEVEIPNRDGDPEISDTEQIPFARFLSPQGRAFSPEAGETYEFVNNFTGNRRLSLAEVERLAEEIVNQVRERGPFLSMSDFVNRRLLPANEDPGGHRLMGPLQAAIQAAGINSTQIGSPESRITADNSALNGPGFHHWDTEAMAGATNRGAAGYLMQADVLSRIGSVLQVRSDTFLIRAYGETPTGARAWCEVLVRRDPDYIDSVNTASELPGSLVPVNERFGRRFEIIRFQWLGEEDV
jgi:hypothetical protein